MLHTLVQTSDLRIDHLPGPGSDLLISFSSIGHDPGQMPSPEFIGTLRGLGPALFVMDAARSWGNAAGLPGAIRAAMDQVRAGQNITRVVMIGQSMGAYAAMVAASLVPVDVLLAFGPQPRIDPLAEPRWREWTSRIANPDHAVCPIPDAPAIWLFHGLVDDLANAMVFPQGPAITHVLFPAQSHHDLCPHLKSRGALRGLVQAVLDGDRRRALRICASAGGINRKRRLDPSRGGAEPGPEPVSSSA